MDVEESSDTELSGYNYQPDTNVRDIFA